MTEISGTDTLNHAYKLNVAAGSFTANFGGGNVTSVASFAPVPEPRAALLGGLGMLALLRRRRPGASVAAVRPGASVFR